MNHLPPAGDGRWRLPRHAHLVVYQPDDRADLLTVYDCGAAQKPPSARLIGNLVRVEARHERRQTPTGYVVDMRAPATLVEQDDDSFVVRSTDG